MKRGEIWTASGGKDYAGKPRPVVIVQDDRFDSTDSITICALTTNAIDAPLMRLPVLPNERNGLRSVSYSITICALTTNAIDAPLMRLPVLPNERNGLRSVSYLMVDKVTTVPKSKLGQRLGSLDGADNVRLDRAILVFLGLTLGEEAESGN